MGVLPLFRKKPNPVITLELNWLNPRVIPGFVRELRGEFSFLNAHHAPLMKPENLSHEVFNQAMISTIRRGYSLRVQPSGPGLFRLNYAHKGISRPSAVKRWLESATRKEDETFELLYGDSPYLRAALPLRGYRGGVHCFTVNGYRNFSLERIRSIHPTGQKPMGSDATLEFELTRKGVQITQGLVNP